MDLDDVIHQDDIELLKAQLANAHQLLGYQQDVIYSLTEQINLKDASLHQVEQEAHHLKHQSQTQTLELSEMKAICSDLREQLKRQTRRRSATPCASAQAPRIFEVQAASPHRETISFGYESSSSATQEPTPLTKAPPVAAWSASQAEIVHEEVTFCQKLTTFIVSSTSKVSSIAASGVVDVPFQAVSQSPSVEESVRPQRLRHSVELPNFSMG